jgi:hypothetical protein
MNKEIIIRALIAAGKSLPTYGNHPIIQNQIDAALKELESNSSK